MDLFLRHYDFFFLKHEHFGCMDCQLRDINNLHFNTFLHLCFRRFMEVLWVCNHFHSFFRTVPLRAPHGTFSACLIAPCHLTDCCSDPLAVFLSCVIKPLKMILNVALCLVFNQNEKAHVTPLASLAVPEIVFCSA